MQSKFSVLTLRVKYKMHPSSVTQQHGQTQLTKQQCYSALSNIHIMNFTGGATRDRIFNGEAAPPGPLLELPMTVGKRLAHQ